MQNNNNNKVRKHTHTHTLLQSITFSSLLNNIFTNVNLEKEEEKKSVILCHKQVYIETIITVNSVEIKNQITL